MDPKNTKEPATKKLKTKSADLKQWITNQTNVGLEITKQLLQTDQFKNTNMVYSPLSIHIVLSIVAAGKTGSDLDKFLSFLKSNSVDDLNSLAYYLITSVLADKDDGPCLNLAVGLWQDKSEPLDASYKDMVCESYRAAVEQVDFKANPNKVRVEVNAWVEKMTQGLITDILSPNSVTNITRRIFANALYFKASWAEGYEFYEPYTKKEDHEFHLLNGASIKGVPYMTSSDSHLIKAFDGFKVLKLLYHGRSFSMCLLLPDARDGLPALAERFCSEPGFIDSHLDILNLGWVDVGEFLIPKFKFSSAFETSGILEKLGLANLLNPTVEIFHESLIEVDEHSTTAAAATVYEEDYECAGSDSDDEPPRKEDFVADHPFLFVIREDMDRTVLFMGHVLNPLAD